jgi:hypothetical protein
MNGIAGHYTMPAAPKICVCRSKRLHLPLKVVRLTLKVLI